MDILNTRESAENLNGLWYAVGELLHVNFLQHSLHWALRALEEGAEYHVWVLVNSYTNRYYSDVVKDGEDMELINPSGPVLMGIRKIKDTLRITGFIASEDADAVINHALLFGPWTY
jgi:hypothetical protein